MKHCCQVMHHWAEVQKYYLISYDPEVREYLFILHGYQPSGDYVIMNYCPWCGVQLPKELGEEWCDVLEKELGINDMDRDIFAALPEEFRTEQWWRRRGL